MKSDPPEPKPQLRPHSHPLKAIWTMLNAIAAFGLLVMPAWALAQTGAGTTNSLPTEIPAYWIPTVLFILVSIVLNGVFIASDTAIELLRSSHVKNSGPKLAARLNELIEHRPKYVAACTLGSQTMMGWQMALSFLPAPSLAHQYAVAQGVPDSWLHVFAIGVLITLPVAALNIVFGILVPKSLAILNPCRVAEMTYAPMRALVLIASLPINFFLTIANVIVKRFGAQASFMLPRQAEDEIRSLVDTAQESGEIEEVEKQLLHSVFEFGDTVAREIMTPRVDLDSAPIEIDADELIELIQSSGHSRIPLYEDTDDQIIGIIHIKDLVAARMKQEKPINLRTLIRPAFFVPENKNLHDLLREMRWHKTQLAVVQDEFGGTAGVVSIEDIVEELVGDIQDEYDKEETEIQEVGSGWLVDGKTNLFDLNNKIGSSFHSEEFDTVGGYLFGLIGRQPAEGETIELDDFQIRVDATDGRRIIRVQIEPKDSGIENLVISS